MEDPTTPRRTRFCGVPKSADVTLQAHHPPKRTHFCVPKSGSFQPGRTRFCEPAASGYGDSAYALPLHQDVYVEPAHTLRIADEACRATSRTCFCVAWRHWPNADGRSGQASTPGAYPFLRPAIPENRTRFCAAPTPKPCIHAQLDGRTKFCGENHVAQTLGWITARAARGRRLRNVKAYLFLRCTNLL